MKVFALNDTKFLGNILKRLSKANMNAMLRTMVTESANSIQELWINEIDSANIRTKKENGGDLWKIEYKNAIGINFTNKRLTAEVSADSENKYVNFVENGIKRYDMKPGLVNGPHSRHSKKYGRYNVIFIRKDTPGSGHSNEMSRETYTTIKKLNKSDAIKSLRVNGLGSGIDMNLGTVKSRTHTKATKIKNKNDKGLVRTGSDKHHAYGVFRIVTEQSKGWIYPGVPPTKIYNVVKRKSGAVIVEVCKKLFETGLEQITKRK